MMNRSVSFHLTTLTWTIDDSLSSCTCALPIALAHTLHSTGEMLIRRDERRAGHCTMGWLAREEDSAVSLPTQCVNTSKTLENPMVSLLILVLVLCGVVLRLLVSLYPETAHQNPTSLPIPPSRSLYALQGTPSFRPWGTNTD